ncbi:OmpA family protein [Acidiphilium sp. PA]|uniref:OmpA family protein n=1 Tax=Acidiphilium sp. PA TaxID=2871705 RepID=UPI002243D7E9|nr:OmpA family protein [Acidiphilium sp. PA]MCW8306724.1 OmpA family protein [Acidiphilium sp. PA]
MRTIGFLSVAFAGAFVAPAAWGQSTGPSALQIIQALKPSSHLSATTRGIVPLQPGSTAPAPKLPGTASAPAAARMSSARHTAPSINLNIDFALGSAQLTPQAITELDRLGHALTDPSLASYKFKLVGHTDTTGTPATNLALSNARAKTVDQYLQSKFNIAPTRLAATGVGEKDLLVPTGPNTPERANRRVQVINLGK